MITGPEIWLLVAVALMGVAIAWHNRGRPLPGGEEGRTRVERFLSSLLRDNLSLMLSGGGLVLGLVGSVAGGPLGLWLMVVGLTVAFGGPVVVALRDQIRQLLQGVTERLQVLQTLGLGVGRLLGRLLPGKGLRRGLGGLVQRAGAPLAVLGKAMGRGLSRWGRRARQLVGAGMVAAAVGLGISGLLVGDSDDVERAPSAGAASQGGEAASGRSGVAVEVDPGWLEGLGRAWFTYEGEERWLAGLEPYLVPGATGVLRECMQRQSLLGWRLVRTTIVEGPQVEVKGPLSQLEYGVAGRGGAVGQPEIRRLYGIELGPADVGVRLSAVVARELPPEKAQLPGVEIITRPQRVDVQFFIVGGRAIPDVGECGRGVAFVG